MDETRIAPPGPRSMLRFTFFLLFFLSGFCSLIYQVIWARMAFAHFGVNTPVLSVVLSVFMAGLGLGSVFGGRVAQALDRSPRVSLAVLYGLCEFTIGAGALAVPFLFSLGDHALLRAGETSSAGYLFLSAMVIAASILPWCVMMGATFPLMMGFIRQTPVADKGAFSFLYVANVVGAMTGAGLTAYALVEAFGFRVTTEIAAAGNFSIALISFVLAASARAGETQPIPQAATQAVAKGDPWIAVVLFTTGFVSLGMEVIWTRAFTFVLSTTIYSFAAVLVTYLAATWGGSYVYRRDRSLGRLPPTGRVLAWACVSALIPVILGDPRFVHIPLLVLMSIAPFCFVLGYLTPRLIDERSDGRPAEAGRAYALNILGGILGPLAAAYLLLPYAGVRSAFLILCAPLFLLFLWSARDRLTKPATIAVAGAFATLFAFSALVSRVYEDGVLTTGPREMRRDYVASVIAYGSGMDKRLMVNGIAITNMTPITKVMAHLPLALFGQPKSALDICFGMGTTFRSIHSWGIKTTAVELSPSVVNSFGFFQPADRNIVNDPNVNIVVDDGRRYLIRSGRHFDVITIDPPPPVEAAGSSLLYSSDF